MRFLLTRRWVVFFLVVAFLGWVALQLGDWQFRRLDERRQTNAIVERNIKLAPVPVGTLLRSDRAATTSDEWRQVTVSGRWDAENTVVVRYRTRDSAPGVEVVTPLRMASGEAVLVDRGWLATENAGSARPKLPAPETGKVTVTGYVRVDATGGSTEVSDKSTRAISSRAIGAGLDYPVARGFVLLRSQVPPPETKLGGPELPEIDDGPHFFYGLQWWFFGLLAVTGFVYLAYDEWRMRRSERAQGAPVDGEHHPGDE